MTASMIASWPEADVSTSDSNKQLIDTLRRSKLFRGSEQLFSEATGLPLALRPVDYWQLDITGKAREPILRVTCRTPSYARFCLQAHGEMIDPPVDARTALLVLSG